MNSPFRCKSSLSDYDRLLQEQTQIKPFEANWFHKQDIFVQITGLSSSNTHIDLVHFIREIVVYNQYLENFVTETIMDIEGRVFGHPRYFRSNTYYTQ